MCVIDASENLSIYLLSNSQRKMGYLKFLD